MGVHHLSVAHDHRPLDCVLELAHVPRPVIRHQHVDRRRRDALDVLAVGERRLLEEMVILTLAEYGLAATRSPGETGVWLDVETPFARKICAMGVRASRWVTMHGFALNVNADLGYFDNIIPCGIRGKGVTSMHVELGQQVDEAEVQSKLYKHFLTLFEARP